MSSDLSNAEALDALNQLRSNVVATQSAGWSNLVYPLVTILNAAGYEVIEDVTDEQRTEHVKCYGGAGGWPGHPAGQAPPQPGDRYAGIGKREREYANLLRRIVAGVKPPTEDEIREALQGA